MSVVSHTKISTFWGLCIVYICGCLAEKTWPIEPNIYQFLVQLSSCSVSASNLNNGNKFAYRRASVMQHHGSRTNTNILWKAFSFSFLWSNNFKNLLFGSDFLPHSYNECKKKNTNILRPPIICAWIWLKSTRQQST